MSHLLMKDFRSVILCEKLAHDANDRISKLNTNFVVGLLNELDAKIENKLTHMQET
jgi:hypothetical protein